MAKEKEQAIEVCPHCGSPRFDMIDTSPLWEDEEPSSLGALLPIINIVVTLILLAFVVLKK